MCLKAILTVNFIKNLVNYKITTSISFLPSVKSVSIDLANTERPAFSLPTLWAKPGSLSAVTIRSPLDTGPIKLHGTLPLSAT